jgi:hypothetical protein
MSVSIQQAAANAIATFLASKMAGVSVKSRFPAPDKDLPPKAITIITAGNRRDTPIDPRILSQVNNGLTQVDAVWQIAACSQPFQLDVWAHSDFDRDAMIADLDKYLNYGERGLGVGNYDPVSSGLLLNLADGWQAYSSTADFWFAEPDTDDTSVSAGSSTYRASFRGDANFMLAIPATSPRQLIINISMFLDGDTAATTYNTDL